MPLRAEFGLAHLFSFCNAHVTLTAANGTSVPKLFSTLITCGIFPSLFITIETVILPIAKADIFADESCTPLLAEGKWIAYKACLRQTSILESVPTGSTWFWWEWQRCRWDCLGAGRWAWWPLVIHPNSACDKSLQLFCPWAGTWRSWHVLNVILMKDVFLSQVF